MKVQLTYYDHSAITREEVVRQARDTYGEFCDIAISPDSDDPWDIVYFGLQQAITHDQLSLLFDSGGLYETKVAEFKAKLLARLESELCEVIRDNEVRVS